MLIRKKHIIHHYTIVEVMVAMGIFLVMMTIMMQFFTSAQQMWNISAKRNDTYADARVAMNLMTREIQCMLYRNQDFTEGTGIYPFWYEWTAIKIAPAATTPLTENYNVDYLTALNFIANTDVKSVDKGSDICEIRYKFVPVYFTTATPTSINDVRGGKLKRSCIGEWESDTSLSSTGTTGNYNFSDFSNNLPRDDSRVDKIWEDYTTSIFKTVISGVYSLKFSCYIWDSGLQLIRPLDTSDSLKDNGGFAASGILATGSPAPVAVRIDMKLLAPEDLKKLAFAIYNSDTKQIRTLKQKMRTFSKVIYLGRQEE